MTRIRAVPAATGREWHHCHDSVMIMIMPVIIMMIPGSLSVTVTVPVTRTRDGTHRASHGDS